MIVQLDICLNAAAPSLPLPVWDAFVGSPSHLRIFNVPQNIGSWRLTKIYVSVKYPDNAIRSVECTKHVGRRIWSATVSGCSTPGFAERGYEIQADGVDEHGEPVTGYVLGAGDVFIRDRDGSITVGETTYYFHLRDAVPSTPKKSDTCVVDGVLKYYNGTAWQPFADIVAPSTDPADAGKAADAKATGDALAWKRSVTDLGLYRKVGVGETWTLIGQSGIPFEATGTFEGIDGNGQWSFFDGETFLGDTMIGDYSSADCEVEWRGAYGTGDFGTATRPFTYQRITDGDALAIMSRLAPVYSASAAYAVGDLCVRDGQLYKCTSAISTAEAWDAAHWAATDIKTELAGKQDALSAAQLANIAAVPNKAAASALRYDLGTAQEIDSEAVETDSTDPENPIDYGEATMLDRTANYVQITAAIDELRISFPAAVSGKIRDFGLRVEVGTGSAALTAPALVVIAPTGETIKLENPDGAMPALADGAADAKGVTLLYFSENPPAGTFLVKGETVQEVA